MTEERMLTYAKLMKLAQEMPDGEIHEIEILDGSGLQKEKEETEDAV